MKASKCLLTVSAFLSVSVVLGTLCACTALSSAKENTVMAPERGVADVSPLDEKEAKLRAMSTHLTDYTLTPLRMGNTTQDAWVVRDADHRPLALLKCNAGNNFAQGEIATYQLGRKLGFNIYPVTVPAPLTMALAKTLHTHEQVCALKEWVTHRAMLPWYAQMNLSRIIKQGQYAQYRVKNTFLDSSDFTREIADTLMCRNQLADIKNREIILSSRKPTKNGSPLPASGVPTLFVGTATRLIDNVRDLSNLMLMDALTGNEDRFPGGNLDFYSTTGHARVLDTRVVIVAPRLFSIDTGASFKGGYTSWGMREMQYYLRRFDPVMIKRLKQLWVALNQPTPEVEKAFSFLNFKTKNHPDETGLTFVRKNLKIILAFVASVQSGKNETYIPDQPPGCVNGDVFLPPTHTGM